MDVSPRDTGEIVISRESGHEVSTAIEEGNFVPISAGDALDTAALRVDEPRDSALRRHVYGGQHDHGNGYSDEEDACGVELCHHIRAYAFTRE